MNFSARFDYWIFNAYTPSAEGLGLFRMVYALFVLLFIAPGHSLYASFTWMAAYPDAFYLPPPGPMQWFSGFPPPFVFEVLHGLLCVSLVAVLLGYRTRAASLLTGCLFLLGYGFYFSFGKINHNMLFVLLPLVMAFSGWGTAYSLDAWRNDQVSKPQVPAWPLALLALLVGFALFTAGFTKLIGGWLDPTTHATQGHLVKQFFTRGRQDLLAPFFLSIHNPVFWEAIDCLTVLFEIGMLAAAFSPIWMRRFCGAAVLFHIGTVVMLNIAFTFNLIVYAAFVKWTFVHDHLQQVALFQRVRQLRLGPLAWIGIAATIAGYFYWVGSPLLFLEPLGAFTSDLSMLDVWAHALALLVLIAWTGVALRHVLARVRSRRHSSLA